ncbi:MAG: ankyrin repeat domain-containing protein [Alphaproteobacteria bacterium]|nr:ankyrin repeat domain-containing protein [Alphaproteobacteria bacterium]
MIRLIFVALLMFFNPCFAQEFKMSAMTVRQMEKMEKDFFRDVNLFALQNDLKDLVPQIKDWVESIKKERFLRIAKIDKLYTLYDVTNQRYSLVTEAIKDELDLPAISMMIKAGADPNERDEQGTTALLWTIDSLPEETEIVNMLLENGAHVNQMNNDFVAPIMMALERYEKNPELVPILIKAHASVDVRDKYGRTPLVIAISLMREGVEIPPKVVDSLIKNRKDIEVVDTEGRTPLSIVLTNDMDAGLVDLFMRSSKVINLPDNLGNTPLMYAMAFHDGSVVKKLLDAGADILMLNNEGKSALSFGKARPEFRDLLNRYFDSYIKKFPDDDIIANIAHHAKDPVLYSNPKALKDYLKRITKFLNRHPEYRTPVNQPNLLLTAVNYGAHIEVIKTLIKEEHKINASVEGWNALRIAALDHNSEELELLLDEGAFIEPDEATDFLFQAYQDPKTITRIARAHGNLKYVREEDGMTPLFYAVKEGSSLPVIRRLIKLGAEINAVVDGKTALFVALTETNRADVVESLLSAGGKAYLPGRTDEAEPIIFAAMNPDPTLVSIYSKNAELVNIKSFGVSPLFASLSSSKSVESAKVLIKNGARLDDFDKDGRTALMVAAQQGDAMLDVVQTLISQNVNINQEDKEGNTALFYALRSAESSDQIVQKLIDAGANAHILTKKDEYPLIYASKVCKSPEVIAALVQGGANVNFVEKEMTPLIYAGIANVDERCIDTLQALIDQKANVNYAESNYVTASMMIAEKTHYPEMLRRLMKAGADIHKIDISGMTLAQYAYKNTFVQRDEVYRDIKVAIENRN